MSQIKVGNIRKLKTTKTDQDEKVNKLIDSKLEEAEKSEPINRRTDALLVPKSSQVSNKETVNDVKRTESKKLFGKAKKVEVKAETENSKADTPSLYRKEFIEDKGFQEIIPPKVDAVTPLVEEKKPVKKSLFFSKKKK